MLMPALTAQFAWYFPKVYQYYAKHLQALYAKHPTLRQVFPESVFPACHFNVGSTTVCVQHVDQSNYAGGGCPVTCGGSFDYKLGGHLILYDLKLVIEFPAGSTIIIPSACVSHGNTAIQPGETRVSFTQFCAGGLIRWVRYGFQSMLSCAVTNPALKLKLELGAAARWVRAAGRFSKVQQLHKDRMDAFKA